MIFLSLEFDKLIKTSLFASKILLNMHFSLLPAYKGCFTSIWPLYFGEERTGVTLHYIDDGIDTGDILDQREIKITPEMTARELYEAYQDAGRDLAIENIKALLDGFLKPRRSQLAEGSSYFSRDSLSRLGLEIVSRATAEQVRNQVRSLFFPEYQTATLGGESISRCVITDVRSTRLPGTIIGADRTTIEMATVDFNVLLTKWNVPGGS